MVLKKSKSINPACRQAGAKLAKDSREVRKGVKYKIFALRSLQ
jgi:hypothetical protein